MASFTTQLTIVNRALQLLGSRAISSLQENSVGARAMNRAYQPCLLAMLRTNFWSFAIKRASLPASSTPPIFGKQNYFPLPGDFVDLAPPDDQCNFNYTDWQIEGQQIASNQKSPLDLRYVSSSITEAMMDVSFAEAFAAHLAQSTCEEITQSNTKMQTAMKAYEDAMNMARQRNAFENRPVAPPTDSWLTARA